MAAEAVDRRFRLRAIVQSAGILSIGTSANFVRAVVTAKVLAVTLGPSPVGVLAQLLNFISFVATVLPLGLTSGVAKLVAQTREDRSQLDRVVWTSIVLSVLSGMAAVLLLVPAAVPLSSLLTGSDSYWYLLVVLILATPFGNLASVLQFILQGLAQVRGLTWSSVGTSLGTLALTVPAAIRFGLTGVAVAVAAGTVLQAALAAAALAVAYRQMGKAWIGRLYSGPIARTLLGYGGIILIGGIAMTGSLVVVRTIGTRQLGDFQNGIYQVAYGISLQYVTVFMTYMGAYVFPRVAVEKNTLVVSELLNSALRANLFMMVPILALVIALREPLIRLLFASSFEPAASLVPVQVMGDYARVIGWSFGVSLFAHGYVRSHLLAVLAQSVLWVVVTAPLVPVVGVGSIPFGYAISFLAWPALMYPMARHWLGVRIERQPALLCILGVAILVVAVASPPLVGVLAAALMPAAVYLARGRRPALRWPA